MAFDVHFAVRNNAFESEAKVTLTKEGVLRIVGPKGDVRLPVHEIGLIELSAESSFASGVSYTCQIYKKRAWFPALTLKSKRYRGPNDFVDQRSEYRQMMAALHGQILQNAWPVKTQITSRPAALMFGLWEQAHWAVLVWIGTFFAVLLGLAAFEPPWAGHIPEISVAMASAAMLAFLGSKLANIRAAYGPWPYDPRAIPAALLPEPLGTD